MICYFTCVSGVRSKFVKLVLISLLLASCSGEQGYRYWHSGSERPYKIKGVRYYPQTSYQYSAVGYSSWYGYDCHGKPTATGRIFNKNKLTAAHRTLPLPSIVIVENLSNGRKVKLLVNDRGPFAHTDKRIIDVSQRAAELLGFRRKGYTKVRVTCLPKESQLAALQYKRRPYPSKKRR